MTTSLIDLSDYNVINVIEPLDYIQYRTPISPDDTIFYAFGDIFRLSVELNPYPIRNAGAVDGWWMGGKVIGEVSMTVDGSIWNAQPGGYKNSAAVLMDKANSTAQKVSGVRIDGVWDGMRFDSGVTPPGTHHNIITGVWISNVRDDAIENDFLGSLSISDSLLDGVYSGISADPGTTKITIADHGDSDTIALDGVLMRLQAFPDTIDGVSGLYGLAPFKMSNVSPSITIHNSVIAFDSMDPGRVGRWMEGWDLVKASSNNYLLWLQDAPLPNVGTVPAGFTILTGQAARDYWNHAKAAWIAAHPEIDHFGNTDTADYVLPAPFTFTGDGDNNTFLGRTTADVLKGGLGLDTVNYVGSYSAVDVDLTRATQLAGYAEGDNLVSIENVIGSAFSDTLKGDAGANVLTGGAGNDTLEGRGGADTLDGGSGTDTASYASSTAAVDIDLMRPTQRAGDATGDALIAIENLIGSSFGDNLKGDNGANTITGGAGNDTLDGRNGADVLDGGTGTTR